MKYFLVCLFLLCSCETTRTNTVSQEVTKEITKETTKNDVFLTGEVAGVPVHLTLKQKGTTDTKSEEKKEEKKEEVVEVPLESNFGWLPELIAGLFGGGTILALIKKIMVYKGTLGHLVTTIEDAPEATKRKILPELSRRMDRKNKDLIKKIKG